MTEKLSAVEKEKLAANIPVQKLGVPLDVANAVLFLSSPLSDYITGQVLAVDGGLAM
jgi:3-oxoacyl-[acyl-carrier protein] reductase